MIRTDPAALGTAGRATSATPGARPRAGTRLSGSDFAVAISLAHLCLIRVWLELLAVSGPNAYYLDVSNLDYLAAATNTALLTGLFLLATYVARGRGIAGRAALAWGFLALLFAQVSGVGPSLSPGVFAVIDRWREAKYIEALLPLVLLGGLGLACWRWTVPTARIARRVVFIAFPFALINLARAGWIVATLNPSEALAAESPPIGAALPESDGPRVVVILMDALSRRHAIDARPADLALPNLDRLRSEAIDATQVTQFANKTIIAVPAMLSGLPVERSEPEDGDELLISVDGRELPWSEQPNVLKDAQDLGGVAVVAGWYHPYCRMFAALDACSTFPTRTVGSRARHTGFWRALFDQQLAMLPYVNLRIRQIDLVEDQLVDAQRAVTLGDRGLVFLHLMIPHTPWIWDDEDDEFTLTRFNHDGYYGNIALMDAVLGDLRQRMEAAGKWDRSAVLFLSDHIMRYRPRYLEEPADPRVPYILKLPGQQGGVTFHRPLSAMITHDLLEALLRGELQDNDAATAWLSARAAPSDPAAAPAPPR